MITTTYEQARKRLDELIEVTGVGASIRIRKDDLIAILDRLDWHAQQEESLRDDLGTFDSRIVHALQCLDSFSWHDHDSVFVDATREALMPREERQIA